MKRLITIIILGLGFSFCNSSHAQIGRLALSPLQKIEQNVAKTDITLEYSRPAMRERVIFGGLVPYDKLWRTGANRNTKISFTQDVIIGETRLKKGAYAIFSIPSRDSWKIFFYTTTDHWDVPEDWDESKIAASINVASFPLNKLVKSLSMSLDDISNNELTLSISWEKTMVSIPIKLTTTELMDDIISKQLSGPSASDYYLAAQYQMEADTKLEEALSWIELGINKREEEVWWDYRIKAIILTKLNRIKAAKKAAEKGLVLAEKKKSSYGINEFKKILK